MQSIPKFRLPPHIATALLSLLMVSTLACNRGVEGSGQSQAAGLPVKVEAVESQMVPESTEYLATLRSRQAAVLQPEVEGQITRIFVRSGDRVQAGAPLLEIDPRKQEASVNSQEASYRAQKAELEYNRKELERRKELFTAGVISRQELDRAESAYDASKAAVDALEAGVQEQQVQLRYHTVKAPASGVIGDIPVRVGDRVKLDTVLTTLDEGGALEAYINIPAEMSTRVRKGLPVEIMGDDDQVLLRASVYFVSPRVDPENQLLLIKAPVPNPTSRFRNEQLVHAHVIWQEQERPVIPVTAVSRLGGQVFAFVVESKDNQAVARQRTLETGGIVGNNYVVLNGLAPGEKVITTGVARLVDGMPVAPES